MTMRSYDDAEFRPWYVRDTKRYLQLSLEARGLVAELLRKWDHHGRIALSADPVGDLSFLLRIDEETTRRAFVELTEPSKAYPVPRLHWDPSTLTLSDPDFAARDRRGRGAQRTAKWRAEKAAKAAAANGNDADETPESPIVTVTSQASPTVTTVTDRHDRPKASLSGLVSSGLISDLSESRSEDPSGRTADPPPPEPKPRRWDIGTAGCQQALAAFEAGAASATGGEFGLAPAVYYARDICALLNKHTPQDLASKADVLAWLRQVTALWVRGADPPTIEPSKLLNWLNNGRKTKSPTRVDTRQPLVGPEPKWLADAKAGRTGTGDF